MTQATLNDFSYVQKQIDRSRINRISWKEILGDTLTTVLYSYFKYGYDADKTYQLVSAKLIERGLLPSYNPKLFENLKISCTARYAEYKRLIFQLCLD